MDRQFKDGEIDEILTVLKDEMHRPADASPPVAEWSLKDERKRSGSVNGVDWDASMGALVVEFLDKPAFLNITQKIERRFGYVILVEFALKTAQTIEGIYLFVQRLNVGDPCSVLEAGVAPKFTDLGFETFLEPFTNEKARFESIAMRPMGMSHLDIRRKVIESFDAKMTVSSLGLSRVVPGTLRILQTDSSAVSRRVSLSPRTRKLHQTGNKLPFSRLVEWAAGIAFEFHKAKSVSELTSDFIRAFAKPASSLHGEAAQSVLIDTAVLRELLCSEQSIYQIVDDSTNSNKQKIPLEEFDVLLDLLDEAVALEPVEGKPGRFESVNKVGDIQIIVDVRGVVA